MLYNVCPLGLLRPPQAEYSNTEGTLSLLQPGTCDTGPPPLTPIPSLRRCNVAHLGKPKGLFLPQTCPDPSLSLTHRLADEMFQPFVMESCLCPSLLPAWLLKC